MLFLSCDQFPNFAGVFADCVAATTQSSISQVIKKISSYFFSTAVCNISL